MMTHRSPLRSVSTTPRRLASLTSASSSGEAASKLPLRTDTELQSTRARNNDASSAPHSSATDSTFCVSVPV
jgi:hypothetical protein